MSSGKYIVNTNGNLGEEFLNSTKIFQYGKTQVPREVRAILKLGDGDSIFWITDGRRIYIKKASI